MVKNGKGAKDRVIPLGSELVLRLHNFIRDMQPDERVFKLKPASITMKIKKFARAAGLADLHAHTLRHKFATDLLERGANLKVVQQLLGHENLATTEVYLNVAMKHLGHIPVVNIFCRDHNTGPYYFGKKEVAKPQGMPYTELDPKTGTLTEQIGPMRATRACEAFWKPVFDRL